MDGLLEADKLKIVIFSLVEGHIGGLVISFLINSFVMPFCKKKRTRKAIARNHRITAKKVRTVINVRPIHSRASNWTGIYEYEYRGRKHHKWLVYVDIPPMTVDLFFLNNVRKAMPEENFGRLENGRIIIILTTIAIALATNLLIGGR